MKRWMWTGLGPFFLIATGVILFFPSSRDNYLLITCSFALGGLITFLLRQRPTLAILEKEYLPIPSVKKDEMEVKYLQTRRQFEEKQEMLNETRKQLFQVENTLLVLQKAEEERLYSQDPLEKELEHCVAIIHTLSEEVELLQETITVMNQVKKGGRPRKPPKQEEQDFLSQLF